MLCLESLQQRHERKEVEEEMRHARMCDGVGV